MPSALRPHVKTIRTSKIKRIQKTNFKTEKQESKRKQRNIYVCKHENNSATFKQATRLLGWERESDRFSLSLALAAARIRSLICTHTHSKLSATHLVSERSSDRFTLIHWKKCKSRAQCCQCEGKCLFDSYCSRGAKTKWRMHEDILNIVMWKICCISYDWQARARVESEFWTVENSDFNSWRKKIANYMTDTSEQWVFAVKFRWKKSRQQYLVIISYCKR